MTQPATKRIVTEAALAATASDRAVMAGAGSTDTTKKAVNVRQGYSGNGIASDLYGAVILGGGQPGFNNIIGGYSTADRDAIGTGTHADKTVTTGSNAHYSIVGGYDNAAGAIASTILAFHAWTAALPTCTHPTIVGGSLHKIRNGEYNGVFGGTNNDVSSSYTGVVAGRNNVVDNLSAGAFVGATLDGVVTDSTGAALLGGQQLEAVTAKYCTVSGLRARARHYGARVHGSGYFAAVGDAQAGDYLLRRSATSGTLALDGSGALLALQDNQTIAATIMVVATAVGGGVSAAWRIDVAAARGAGAATTRLLGTPSTVTLGKDSGAASWAPTVAANSAGDLRITFTGDGTTTIRIQARVMTCEVIG